LYSYISHYDASKHGNNSTYQEFKLIVTTTKGDMDDSLLEKREGNVDNENELTAWVEYWLEGELVHRSAHVTLKKMPVFGGGETQVIG
jgi:hypothetical protein